MSYKNDDINNFIIINNKIINFLYILKTIY